MQKSTMPIEIKVAIGTIIIVTYKLICVIKGLDQGHADGLMVGMLLLFAIENVAEGITKWLKKKEKKGKIRLRK